MHDLGNLILLSSSYEAILLKDIMPATEIL